MAAFSALGKLTILALAVWILLLVYISGVLVKMQTTPSGGSEGSGVAAEALQRIDQATKDIERLRKQNEDLKRLLVESSRNVADNLAADKDPSKHDSLLGHPKNIPRLGEKPTDILGKIQPAGAVYQVAHLSPQHDQLRRKVENGVLELFFHYSSQLRHLTKTARDAGPQNVPETEKAFKNAIDSASAHFYALMADAQKLGEVDGAGTLRDRRLQNLTNLMQKRIKALQNPPDCANARKLLCNLNKGCGFGCQLHHVAYCFVIAYGTERTLILQNDGREWRYSSQGWTAAFLPVSDSCFDGPASANPWISIEGNKNHQVVSLPIVDGLSGRPPYLPQSFPKDLADDLVHLHGDPPAWFIGQFVSYLMRSSPKLEKWLGEAESRIRFGEDPIVGLQVRRTDKVGTEAAFHAVDEYIAWVEHWFAIESLKQGKQLKKRIFIATDDPKVVVEAKEKYKDYEIFADPSIATSAQMSSRYSDDSLFGVITDIRMLSKCDYLVCTFSSQVCRLAYELMQVDRGDAASWFHSLDDIYYYGGQQGHEQEVIISHTPSNEREIELRVGDVVGVAGNHWDGFSKGRNSRTGQVGLYPSYKVKEKWRIVDFPSYPNVKV